MRNILAYFLILLTIASCTGHDAFVESRVKTAEKFVQCLSDYTPDRILDFTYPNIDDKIKDKESREFYVNKAHKFITKFGLPPKDKWVIKFDPKNNFERLLITIPVFKGYDSAFNLLQADIVIAFPPPQISSKISSYEIEDKYDFSKEKPILGLPPFDKIRKN